LPGEGGQLVDGSAIIGHYRQYKIVKADDVKAFWNVVNWTDVQQRFHESQQSRISSDGRLTPGKMQRRASSAARCDHLEATAANARVPVQHSRVLVQH
jgi:hypothetical protein